MKHNIYSILFKVGVAASLLAAVSCEDFVLGERSLQKPPSTDVTIDTIFANKENAERVLWKSYSKLYYGMSTGWNLTSGMWVAYLECLTDLSHSYIGYGGAEEHYYPGLYSAGTEDKSGAAGATKYRFKDYGAWKGIRMAWIFHENVDKVPDMTAQEKARMKAEAKTMIALRYVELIRNYGSVPILDHAINTNEQGGFPSRPTLQECEDFVLGLLDEAIAEPEFPFALYGDEKTIWQGRLTKAAALGLKARLLLFLASPLFNSDEPYFKGEASDKLMTWFGKYDATRWDAALSACEDFFKELDAKGGYELEKNASSPRLGYRNAYFSPNSLETIAASRRFKRSTDNGPFMQSARWGGMCPTKEFFDMFPMADGTDFSWDDPVHKANPFINRDPRLSENILLDGDIFGSGTADVCKAKTGDSNYPKGAHWGLSNALDSKSLESGIAARKWALDRQGEYKQQPIQWPILRLAEIYLTYAEALNECGRTDEAYQYINAVRDRVDVGPVKAGLSKEEMREQILRERAIEFAWEDVRWFDLIRWKREADFKKPLHNLYVYRHKTTKAYEFEFTETPARAWQTDFSAKWYLSAFPLSEVNKGYGLVQNPGWE